MLFLLLQEYAQERQLEVCTLFGVLTVNAQFVVVTVFELTHS